MHKDEIETRMYIHPDDSDGWIHITNYKITRDSVEYIKSRNVHWWKGWENINGS